MPYSHINVSQFEELKDLLEDDFMDLIQSYIADSEQRLNEIQTAFEQDDNRLGFEASHSLKGASSNLGATSLTELCYQLQEICRTSKIKEHQSLIDDIKRESATVNEQIRALIA